MISRERTFTRRAWLRLIGGSAVLGVLGVLGVYVHECWLFDARQITTIDGTEPSDPFLKVRIPGIVRPATVAASSSTLSSAEMVVGFVVAGRARAYRLEALRHRTNHIVNDLVGDIPLTVSFCDIDNCVRCWIGEQGSGPLDLSVAGLFEGQKMIVEVNQTLYFQGSGKAFTPSTGPAILPLKPIEPTLTNWASWKRDHPDTDVYEGRR